MVLLLVGILNLNGVEKKSERQGVRERTNEIGNEIDRYEKLIHSRIEVHLNLLHIVC